MGGMRVGREGREERALPTPSSEDMTEVATKRMLVDIFDSYVVVGLA